MKIYIQSRQQIIRGGIWFLFLQFFVCLDGFSVPMACPSIENPVKSGGTYRRLFSVDFFDTDADECAVELLDNGLESDFCFSTPKLYSLS